MIGRKGNSLTINPSVFLQLEKRYLFPTDLIKKKLLGYVCSGNIWMLYEEDQQIFKVPFCKNLYYLKAMTSEPEYSALRQLPQIYLA